ncbi:MAG: hypothetical protein QNJ06_08905 [Kiloniellales bacterium]|nr:hypothetical protein [Kiloniellales bacterium]
MVNASKSENRGNRQFSVYNAGRRAQNLNIFSTELSTGFGLSRYLKTMPWAHLKARFCAQISSILFLFPPAARLGRKSPLALT